jgi:hypothetical protein
MKAGLAPHMFRRTKDGRYDAGIKPFRSHAGIYYRSSYTMNEFDVSEIQRETAVKKEILAKKKTYDKL